MNSKAEQIHTGEYRPETPGRWSLESGPWPDRETVASGYRRFGMVRACQALQTGPQERKQLQAALVKV